MSDSRLNIGVIGAGRIGRVHIESLTSRLRNDAYLSSLTDVNGDAASAVARQFGIPKVPRSSAALFADPEIDAVLICSSTDTHAALITAAAEAGKHIFCEKPIALELGEIDSALNAVDRAGVKLQIGFNRRFDANFARVRQAVVSGEIGEPQLLHIVSRDPAPPPIEYIRVSGGMFGDMTIHDFDMARFLIGDEVDEIYTAAQVMVDPEIGKAGDVDTAVIVLRFRNGVIGTIDNSRRAAYGYDQRVEVFGSSGKISTENWFPNQATVSAAHCIYRDLPLNFFMDRYAASFTNEMQSFISAICDGTPTPVNGQDGRAPVLLAKAALKSYQTGKPVKVADVAREAQHATTADRR